MKFAVIGGVCLFLLLFVAISVVSLNNPDLLAGIPFFKTVRNFKENQAEPRPTKEEPSIPPNAEKIHVPILTSI
jgi:hypothetical protein